MTHLINYLPVIFKNEDVTIYELPNFSPPVSSNLTILYPQVFQSENRTYFPLDSLALSGLQYDISVFGDSNVFNSSCIFLPEDLTNGLEANESIISNVNSVNTFENWVSKGGEPSYN